MTSVIISPKELETTKKTAANIVLWQVGADVLNPSICKSVHRLFRQTELLKTLVTY